MNLPYCSSLQSRLIVLLFVFGAPGSLRAAEPSTGEIRGIVTNAGGRTFIEGARVTDVAHGVSTTTDRRGEFLVTGLAPGRYRLQVTYTGMDPESTDIDVAAGETAFVALHLSEDVVVMGAFSVVSDRSADALALTQQRNAANIKNVVDTESYGSLNNDNPAELLQMLPGVFGSFFAGEVDRVSIRGFSDSLNNVQLDGNPMATPAINSPATDRSSVLSTTNVNNIKTAEVIKALTPDRSADAIGGMVNLIQRTGLDYPQSAGHFSYKVGGQYVTTESGWDTRVTPTAQLTYHDALGDHRKWGVYVTGGMNKETTNQFSTNQTSVNNATFGVVPNVFSSTENDRYRYRKNWAATVNYRPSFDHEWVVKYKHDEWFEETEFLVTQFIPSAPTSDWTRDVRSYNGRTFTVNHPHNPAEVKTDSFSLDGNDRLGEWQLDYGLYSSHSKAIIASDARDDWGTVTATLLPSVKFSYIVDSRQDFSFPSRRITSGNEEAVYDPDNFVLSNYQQVNFHTDDKRYGGRVDLTHIFDLALPITVKAGTASSVQSRVRRERRDSRDFVGEDGVAGVNPITHVSDDRLSRFVVPGPFQGNDAAGNRRPFILDTEKVAHSYQEHPDLWIDDVYNNTLNSFIRNFDATERITAGYLMGETDVAKLHLLGGVRWEQTKVDGIGVFRNPVQATAAQIPDPVERAINNAGEMLRRTRKYDDWFPSIHLAYTLRPDLLLRASYSTGIGRQGYGAIIPTTTINDTLQRVTTNNTALEPEHADSYDLSLEYYIKPAGIMSVGLFRKEIRDFVINTIGTVEPGSELGEQYVGYELRTAANGGTATVQGIEFNYVQQLNFIPRQLGLFTLKGNLTVLRAEGDFGGTTNISSSRVPDFVPRAWNLIGEYTFGRFHVLCRYNRQAAFLVTAGATPEQDNVSAAREKVDLNLEYRWRKGYTFFLAIDNLTNQPTAFRVLGSGDEFFAGQVYEPQRRFNFGVRGEF